MRTSPYRFPAVTEITSVSNQLWKIDGEVAELKEAVAYESMPRVIEETLDVIHSCETLLRKIGTEEQVAEGVRQVTEKNRERGYYD